MSLGDSPQDRWEQWQAWEAVVVERNARIEALEEQARLDGEAMEEALYRHSVNHDPSDPDEPCPVCDLLRERLAARAEGGEGEG
jgi:hypothetical protein